MTNAADEIHIHVVTSLLLPLTSLRNAYARNPAPMPFVIEYVSGMTKTVSKIAKPVAKSTLPVLLRSRSGLNMKQPLCSSGADVASRGADPGDSGRRTRSGKGGPAKTQASP